MDELLISVIVPVYKVEKYIHKCIDSIVEQTYRNLEIILVDDGSPDQCGEICDQYKLKDYRVKVLHKENGGLSSARNAGIEISQGDGIFFVDSDDYLSRRCIEKCVDMLRDYDADISIIQMMYISETMNKEIEYSIPLQIDELNAEEAIAESLYQVKYSCNAPAKLYKREVISNIRFPKGMLSEDLATCHLLLNNARKVVCSNEYEYYYRQHRNSIMHTFTPNRIDALKWALEIECFCTERYPKIKAAAMCRTFNVAIHLLLDLPSEDDVQRRRTVLCDKNARARERGAAFLSLFGNRILKIVWNSRLAVRRKEINIRGV